MLITQAPSSTHGYVRRALFLPFIALLCGVGVGWTLRNIRARGTSLAAGAAIMAIFLLAADRLSSDSQSIVERGSSTLATLISDRMSENPDQCFRVSAAVAALLDTAGVALTTNDRVPIEPFEIVVLDREFREPASELQLKQWPTYVSGFYDQLGPREVDFNYYPNWMGDERILIFAPDRAEIVGLSDRQLAQLGMSASCVVPVP